MLQLPDSLKDYVRHLTLSRSHALELMRLPSAELQEKVAGQIVAQDMNIANARSLIGKMLENTTNSPQTQEGNATPADKGTPKTPSPFGGEGGPATAGRDEGEVGKPTQSSSSRIVSGDPVSNGVDARGKPHPTGFRFNKVGKDIHIIGMFPGTTPPQDMVKAFEGALQNWLASKAATSPKKPATRKVKPAVVADLSASSPSTLKGEGRDEGVVGQPTQPSSLDRNIRGQAPRIVSGDPVSLDTVKKMADAMGGLKEGAPNMAGLMAVQLEASLAMMNQRLANPNINDEDKAKLKEAIKQLQEKLAELKSKENV